MKVLKTKGGEMKKEILRLWWSSECGKYNPAGVAFFDEKFGEYRLKIDMHPETAYYLRPIMATDSKSFYRVESVIKSEGKFKGRRPVGDGWDSGNDIFINLWPYERSLLLKEGEFYEE